MGKVKCGLCPEENWVLIEGVVDHLETEHPAAVSGAERWPDGQLVIFDEDEIDALTLE